MTLTATPIDSVPANLGPIEGVVLDIDGVLMVSGSPLPGARDALLALRAAAVPVAFLTNMTRPRSAVLAHLAGLGVDIDPRLVISAPGATHAYLQRAHPGQSCLLLASDGLREDFDGVALTRDPAEATVVVIGGPHDDEANDYLAYERMNDAFAAVQRGASLVAMQRGMSWQTRRGLALDAGAFVAALEAATGVRATVCGKPSSRIFAEAVDRLGLPPQRVLMVGDDIENDIKGAAAAGLRPALVRTGKFQPRHMDAIRGIPTHLLDSVADVPALVLQG